jgi:hypothetical protein
MLIPMFKQYASVLFSLGTSLTLARAADPTPATPPTVLPGKGPTQHPFLYAGEWDTRKPLAQSMFIVRDGKIVWQYFIPIKAERGGNREFDGATLLSNGNIIFSCMSGVGEVSPDKKVVRALSSWHDPDLGPATSIQLLDEPGVVENGDLQR